MERFFVVIPKIVEGRFCLFTTVMLTKTFETVKINRWVYEPFDSHAGIFTLDVAYKKRMKKTYTLIKE